MQTDFLVEYNGAGGKGNDPECAAVVDMENQYDCKYDIYDCKCRDCFNNTFTCVRTIDGEDTDTVLCQFQASLIFGIFVYTVLYCKVLLTIFCLIKVNQLK